jgi:hypothetical protein
MTRTIVALAIGIVALDAVESLIARSAGFDYAWFMLVQIGVYLAIGFALRRVGTTLRMTALVIAITAVVEGTAGEWVAVTLGAAPATPLPVMLVAVPVAIVFEIGLGLAGFALASIGKPARP